MTCMIKSETRELKESINPLARESRNPRGKRRGIVEKPEVFVIVGVARLPTIEKIKGWRGGGMQRRCL